MLSFEVDKIDKSVVEIYCDAEGITKLISALQALKDDGSGHVHLRSWLAGGHFLDDRTPWDKDAVSEAIVSL